MKNIYFLLLAMTTTLAFSQNAQDSDLENFARLNIGLFGVEASYELPVLKKLVWENGVGLGMGMNHENNSTQYVFDLSEPSFFLKSQLKYLYNRQKRAARGKSNRNNTGNYVGLQSKYSFGRMGRSDQNSALLTEVHWGIQGNLGKRFLYNTHMGLGYLRDFDNRMGTITPTLGLRFSYRLF